MLRLVQFAKYYYYLLRLRYNLCSMECGDLEADANDMSGYVTTDIMPWIAQITSATNIRCYRPCHNPSSSSSNCCSMTCSLFTYVFQKLHVSQIIPSYSICKWIPHIYNYLVSASHHIPSYPHNNSTWAHSSVVITPGPCKKS